MQQDGGVVLKVERAGNCMLLDLPTLLSYRNANVMARYKADYPDAGLTGEQALSEFLKFVWLYHRHQHERSTAPDNPALAFRIMIHSEMRDIDDMWHTFLLFTKDYHAFCREYLQGDFFHHAPAVESERYHSREEFATEFSLYLGYIYDNLGEETLQTWFGDM